MVRAQGQKQDYGDWHANEPQQHRTHDRLLSCVFLGPAKSARSLNGSKLIGSFVKQAQHDRPGLFHAQRSSSLPSSPLPVASRTSSLMLPQAF